jgi:hypothetical protein
MESCRFMQQNTGFTVLSCLVKKRKCCAVRSIL